MPPTMPLGPYRTSMTTNDVTIFVSLIYRINISRKSISHKEVTDSRLDLRNSATNFFVAALFPVMEYLHLVKLFSHFIH